MHCSSHVVHNSTPLTRSSDLMHCYYFLNSLLLFSNALHCFLYLFTKDHGLKRFEGHHGRRRYGRWRRGGRLPEKRRDCWDGFTVPSITRGTILLSSRAKRTIRRHSTQTHLAALSPPTTATGLPVHRVNIYLAAAPSSALRPPPSTPPSPSPNSGALRLTSTSSSLSRGMADTGELWMQPNTSRRAAVSLARPFNALNPTPSGCARLPCRAARRHGGTSRRQRLYCRRYRNGSPQHCRPS